MLRFKGHRETNSTLIYIYQTCNDIGENVIFATRVILILLIYRIQNQVG